MEEPSPGALWGLYNQPKVLLEHTRLVWMFFSEGPTLSQEEEELWLKPTL